MRTPPAEERAIVKRSKFTFPADPLEYEWVAKPCHVTALIAVLNRHGANIEPLMETREKIRLTLEVAASGTLAYLSVIEDPAEWTSGGLKRERGRPAEEALGNFTLRMADLFRQFVPHAPEPYLNGSSQEAVGPILDFIENATFTLGLRTTRTALLRCYQRARDRRAKHRAE